jgi:hypothetical protein
LEPLFEEPGVDLALPGATGSHRIEHGEKLV